MAEGINTRELNKRAEEGHVQADPARRTTGGGQFLVRLATRKSQMLQGMPGILATIIQVSGRARPQSSAKRLISNKLVAMI